MRNSIKSIVIFLILLLSEGAYAQQKVALRGFIQDAETGEKLIGASVIIEDLKKGTVSNRFGFFSLSIYPGEYKISFSYVGYKKESIKINLSKDSSLIISLKTGLKIDEITVKGRMRNSDFVQSSEIGTNMILIDEIKNTPVIGGETDVLKTLQFLPGIKQSQEGTSGINVRGGSPDQNQILLDGVPVYNTSHLFGFLSVFNSDAISQVKVYKGGIPAQYGGYLSSLLDISMKEGNMKRPQSTFSISPISGRITIEGPIKNDTASFILSGRRTFLDIPIRLILSATQPIQAGYFFYDYTAKMNWKIDAKNRIFFSSYLGKDNLFMNYKEDKTKSNFGYNWGNITSVLRWNSEISSRLFSNTMVYYSRFYNHQNIKIKDDESYSYKINSGLSDLSVSTDFYWYPNLNHPIKFGIKSSWQTFSPQLIKTKSEKTETTYGKGKEYKALTGSLYFEDDIFISKKLGVNLGFRTDCYRTGGKNFFNFQPRVSAKYIATSSFAVKASFAQMNQYLHLLSNSSIGLPTDLWVSSTKKMKPQEGWQTSIGMFIIPNSFFDFSIEAYYKEMNNVIRFDEGESFFDSRQQNWEDKVIVGNGNAYGVEFLMKKNIGNLTGRIGYTLSWSNRKFEALNNGNWFPYRYDKRHDLSVLCDYKLFDDGTISKTFTLGFTFNTGYAVSIPDIKLQGLNILTDNGDYGYLGLFNYLKKPVTYEKPNNYRMPGFHHLDIGYHISRKISNYKSRTWSFSVYNVYNKLNPWYFYKDEDKLKQVSIFPIIPSISYTYKW